MDWHADTAAKVALHYPSVRGMYSAEATLHEKVAERLQINFTKNTIRDIYAEVQGFLRDRISELRTLMNWQDG